MSLVYFNGEGKPDGKIRIRLPTEAGDLWSRSRAFLFEKRK